MPNRIRIALLVWLAVFAHALFAADERACPPAPAQPTPEMMQAAMRDARDHGFLWRITRDGHTSYLYGTIHVAAFDWMFPGPGVLQALRSTDTMALELDMLDPDIRERMAKGIKSMRSPALPKPLLQRLQRQAAAACIPYGEIAGLPVEFQITALTLVEGRREGLEAAYAIDAVLAGIGHGAKKNVVSLETPEAQLRTLQMQDPRDAVAFVEDGLEEIESGRTRTGFRRIARVWADADYDELARYSEWCDCLNTEIERKEMRRLLDERNPNLAERIDSLHASGKRVFAAVGSLHMFGPTGLPALMEKRGYRVERMDLRSK
ncbi:TraB/GumN family protein [Sideroxyarcus emersonii]|nr:TraB/GumN family protein [Sideroxyarcus emersonii]